MVGSRMASTQIAAVRSLSKLKSRKTGPWLNRIPLPFPSRGMEEVARPTTHHRHQPLHAGLKVRSFFQCSGDIGERPQGEHGQRALLERSLQRGVSRLRRY